MVDIPSNQEAIVKEVVSAIEDHQKASYNLLQDRDLFLNMYKGVNYTISRSSVSVNQITSSSGGLANLPAPVIAESVETLTNAIYAMLTASDPNFSLEAIDGSHDESALYKNTQLLRMQDDKTKRRKKLMTAIRSVVLNGSAFVEQPWVSWPPGEPNPAWEATDFIPRPFTDMFWMPHAIDIDYSDYIGTAIVASASQLRSMADMDTDEMSWIPWNVEIALKETEKEEFIGPEIRKRLQSLGYQTFKHHKELATYWGPLHSVDGGKQDWVVGIVNRKYLVRFHPSPYPRGMRPFRFAQHIQLEGDTMGIGVGHQLQSQQKYINSNLNRTMDILTLATFHILFANKYAGLKNSQMKFKPWYVIDVDDVNGIRNFPVDLAAAQHGLKLHEFLVEQARNHTGATPTLQAVITEASASEVKIAQNNSMRAVSNKADLISDEFIREAKWFDNFNNYLWLDNPIWLRAAGMERPMLIHPSEISHNIGVAARTITDKDYTPQKLKNALQLLQIVSSIRNQLPPDSPLWGLVAEITRSLGYDPARFNLQQAAQQQQPNPAVLLGMLNKEAAMAQSSGSLPEQLIQAQQGMNQIANG